MPGNIAPKGRKWSVDTTRWPVVVVTQHAVQLTDDERREALEATDRALDTAKNVFAIVHDSRFAGPVSPRQRAMIAEFAKKAERRSVERCAAAAFVFDSIVMRSALTAILWLKPAMNETKVFSSLDEAVLWARSKIDERQARDHGNSPELM